MQNSLNHNQPLAEIKTGEHVIFQTICTDKVVASRLTSLGFTPGVEIVMTQNYGHGPLVVNIRGTKVALGRWEAKNILVQKDPTK